MAPAQNAAWDAYLTLTTGLLPALRADQVEPGVNPRLGRVAIRIVRYAPLWGEDGPMLVCALQNAMQLYRDSEHADLLDLLRIVADRLYLLSARPALM